MVVAEKGSTELDASGLMKAGAKYMVLMAAAAASNDGEDNSDE